MRTALQKQATHFDRVLKTEKEALLYISSRLADARRDDSHPVIVAGLERDLGAQLDRVWNAQETVRAFRPF